MHLNSLSLPLKYRIVAEQYCTSCDRSFASNMALVQHLRDSPMHAPSFDCNDCHRAFASGEALSQPPVSWTSHWVGRTRLVVLALACL